MENLSECLICGQPLEYVAKQETMTCSFCGESFASNAHCRSGHYVCDSCHEKKGIEAVMKICRDTHSKNPFEILLKMMENPYIYMHGPEHHVMVGAALLTACRNVGKDMDFDEALEEMKNRGRQIPGGICGFWGTCGAAISVGICFSILTSSDPLSSETWGLGNQLTSKCLNAIGSLGGPRCCKRDSFTALITASEFIKEQRNIPLRIPKEITCRFFRQNAQCIRLKCPYFPGSPEKKAR